MAISVIYFTCGGRGRRYRSIAQAKRLWCLGPQQQSCMARKQIEREIVLHLFAAAQQAKNVSMDLANELIQRKTNKSAAEVMEWSNIRPDKGPRCLNYQNLSDLTKPKHQGSTATWRWEGRRPNDRGRERDVQRVIRSILIQSWHIHGHRCFKPSARRSARNHR